MTRQRNATLPSVAWVSVAWVARPGRGLARRHALPVWASLVCGLVCCSAASSQEAPAPQEITLEFDSKAVAVGGLKEGARVALFGMSRSHDGVYTVVARAEEVLTDEDGDGVVQWDPGIVIGARSIWMAMDLSSGAYAIDAPVPGKVRELPFPADGLQRGVEGRLDRLVQSRSYLEVLLARPGETGGLWVGSFNDGGAGDEDAVADGKVEASLLGLEPIAGDLEPPLELGASDLVLMVDRRSLDFTAIVLAD